MDTITFLSQHWVAFAVGSAIAYFCAGINQIFTMGSMFSNIKDKRIDDIKMPMGGLARAFFCGFIGVIMMILAIAGFAGILIQHFSA